MTQAKKLSSLDKGYIYVARNDMANVTKIGITTVDPESRVFSFHRDYSASGHWRVYCAYRSASYRRIESLAHRNLAPALERRYGSREMFRVSPEAANVVVCNAIFQVINIRPVSGHYTYEWIDKNRKEIISRIESAKKDLKKIESHYNAEFQKLQKPHEKFRFFTFYIPLIIGGLVLSQTEMAIGALVLSALFIFPGHILDEYIERRILRRREKRKSEVLSIEKAMTRARYKVVNELQLQKDLASL